MAFHNAKAIRYGNAATGHQHTRSWNNTSDKTSCNPGLEDIQGIGIAGGWAAAAAQSGILNQKKEVTES